MQIHTITHNFINVYTHKDKWLHIWHMHIFGYIFIKKYCNSNFLTSVVKYIITLFVRLYVL